MGERQVGSATRAQADPGSRLRFPGPLISVLSVAVTWNGVPLRTNSGVFSSLTALVPVLTTRIRTR